MSGPDSRGNRSPLATRLGRACSDADRRVTSGLRRWNMRDEHAEVTAVVDALARFAEPEVRRDPYPFLRWLRESEPVHRTAAGFYLVSRHADAARVMQDSATFLSP